MMSQRNENEAGEDGEHSHFRSCSDEESGDDDDVFYRSGVHEDDDEDEDDDGGGGMDLIDAFEDFNVRVRSCKTMHLLEEWHALNCG